jgi:hypothetical protein
MSVVNAECGLTNKNAEAGMMRDDEVCLFEKGLEVRDWPNWRGNVDRDVNRLNIDVHNMVVADHYLNTIKFPNYDRRLQVIDVGLVRTHEKLHAEINQLNKRFDTLIEKLRQNRINI